MLRRRGQNQQSSNDIFALLQQDVMVGGGVGSGGQENASRSPQRNYKLDSPSMLHKSNSALSLYGSNDKNNQ